MERFLEDWQAKNCQPLNRQGILPHPTEAVTGCHLAFGFRSASSEKAVLGGKLYVSEPNSEKGDVTHDCSKIFGSQVKEFLF